MSTKPDDFPPYLGVASGDWIADRTRGEVRHLRAENERLRTALSRLVEELEVALDWIPEGTRSWKGIHELLGRYKEC